MDDSIDLLYALLNISEDDVNLDEACNLLYDKYRIDFKQFEKLARDLLKFTPIVRTALTDTPYHAFVTSHHGLNMMLMREEIEE